MRNLKKFLALVLAMMMVFSMMMTVSAAGFGDISGNAYEDAIKTLYNYGIVRGTDDGTFSPNGQFTRAEMAGIAYRIATGDVEDKYKDQNARYATDYFTDVPANHWAAGYIGFCYNWGIVEGVGNDMYNPSGLVTGYEIAGLMLRLLGYGVNGEYSGNTWQKNIGEQAQKIGITTGLGTTGLGNTSLSAIATRAQVAEVAYQAAFNASRVDYVGGGYQLTGEKLVNEEYVERTTDGWGAPANKYYASFTWPVGYDVTAENLIADEPVLETWMPVSQAEVVTAAGSETVTIYTNGEDGNCVQTGATIDKNKTTTSANDAMGGYGRWTRVYKGIVVYVDTFLTYVSPLTGGISTYYNAYAPAIKNTAGSGPIDGADQGSNAANNAASGSGYVDNNDDDGDIVWQEDVTPTTGLIASYARVYNVYDGYPTIYTVSAFDGNNEILGERVEAYPLTGTSITVRGIAMDTDGNVVGIEATNGRTYYYNCTYTYDGYDPTGSGTALNDAGRLYYSDIGTTRTIYLDANGFIVGIAKKDIDTSTNTGVVVGYNYGTIEPGKYYGQVTVLKFNGQQETIKFIDINDTTQTITVGGNALTNDGTDQTPYTDDKVAYMDASLLMGHLIQWTPDNASANATPKYTGYQVISLDDTNGSPAPLTNANNKIEVGDADALKLDVTTGSSNGLLVDDNTKFFVVNYQMKNSENGYVFTNYGRYEGFQALPGDLSVDTSKSIVADTNPNKMASEAPNSTLDVEYISEDGQWADYVLIINASSTRTNVVEPVANYAFMVDPNKFVIVRDDQYEYRAIMNGRANQAFQVTYNATDNVTGTGLYTYDERTNNGWADVTYKTELMFKGGSWKYNAGVLHGMIGNVAYTDADSADLYYTVAKTGATVYIVDPQTGAIEKTTTAAALTTTEWNSVTYGYNGCDIWFQLNRYGYIDVIYIMNSSVGVEGNTSQAIGAEVVIDAVPAATDKLTTIGTIVNSIKATGATKYRIADVQVQKMLLEGGSTWTYCSRGETVNKDTYAYRVEITFAALKNVGGYPGGVDYYFDATSNVSSPLTATNAIVLSYTRDTMVVGVLVSVS